MCGASTSCRRASGAILCPNHISFLDSAFLMLTLPRRISFVGKAEYMDSWKTKYLFPAIGMIPIDRSGGNASSAALDAAEGVLRRGELFGIFPEGTRSRDGVLHKGHTGPARLALDTGCPIYPVGIVGTGRDPAARRQAAEALPVVRHHHRRPDRSGPLRRPPRRPPRLRQLIDEVMFEIRELTGQEYRDSYATKRPEAIPAEPAHVRHVNERAGSPV